MSLFKKKPHPADRPFNERAKALRDAIYHAMSDLAIRGPHAASILEDIAQCERMARATTAPLDNWVHTPFKLPPGLRGEQPKPSRPLSDLAKTLLGQ